jgi:hypothetical protein
MIAAPLASRLRAGKLVYMGRVWALTALMLALSGCGLAETGTAAATGAAAEAQQAAQAKSTEERVQQRVDAANQQAADQRAAAESQGQ